MDGACEQRAVTVLGAALGETGRETQIAPLRITAMEEDEFMSAWMVRRWKRSVPTPWSAPITTIFGTLMT